MKIGVICFTARGCRTALELREVLTGPEEGDPQENQIRVWCKKKDFIPPKGIERVEGSLREWTGQQFERNEALIFVGATGIAVRAIAPFLEGKTKDPAVLTVDELGHFVISLVSGHLGGANELCRRAAEKLGAIPVITTATDLNRQFAVDVFAKKNGLQIHSMEAAKMISASLLEGDRVAFESCLALEGELPPGLYWKQGKKAEGWSISVALCPGEEKEKCLFLIPRAVVLGIGCRKGKSPEELEQFVLETLEKENISIRAVKKVCSIDLKAEEQALLQFCRKYGLPFETFTAEELKKTGGDFASSAFVNSRVGVDNVCERSAVLGSGGGKLILEKTAGSGITVAAALEDGRIRFE